MTCGVGAVDVLDQAPKTHLDAVARSHRGIRDIPVGELSTRSSRLFAALATLAMMSAGCVMGVADDEMADPSSGGALAIVGSRTNWQSNGPTYFQQVPGSVTWVEDGPGGKTYFTETHRTSEYIELHDPNRDLYMRLYDGYAQLRVGTSGPWNTWEFTGHWVG